MNAFTHSARFVLATVLSISACSAQATPRYDAETFFQTVSLRGASFSPDGEWILFTSDRSGVFNAHRVPFSGGDAEALTDSTTDAITTIGYFPADDRFLYTSDAGGNELNHVFVRHPEGGALDLTPGEGLKARFMGWSRDDRAFFLATNERDPRFFDLYRYAIPEVAVAGAVEAYERSMVFENEGGFELDGVSPNGRWVALGVVRTNADRDVYVSETAADAAEPIHVTPHEGDAMFTFSGFSSDSRTLRFGSDRDAEFRFVMAFDLETGERSVVARADWDVQGVGESRDGRYRVTSINADARTVVTVTDQSTGDRIDVAGATVGNVESVTFARSGTRVAFYVRGDTQPANLHVLDLETGDRRQLTDSGNPAIDPEHLVASEVIRYPSFDGLEIPALLYRPRDASKAAPVPALLWVHGGPGGQSRVGYRADIQHLVNHGIAILAVNNRGSSGYGKSFYHLDDRRHGDHDLKDCVWARRYLEGLDWVDGEHIGIMGGSYGGYMVAAALAFEPEAFELGIDIFGVTNWVRTLESIPPWWTSMREALYAELGDPATDRERLTAMSPLFHADRIVRPLLIVQGANDPRVLQVESDELVEKVRANGVPVEYVLFPDEGHGFRRRENRIRASEAWLAFAEKYLRPDVDRDQ